MAEMMIYKIDPLDPLDPQGIEVFGISENVDLCWCIWNSNFWSPIACKEGVKLYLSVTWKPDKYSKSRVNKEYRFFGAIDKFSVYQLE